MLGVEPAEDIRCGRFLEFDRGDEAQDVIPELDNVLIIAVRRRLNLPRRAIQELAVPEAIEPLTLEVLETESFLPTALLAE
jgi:hypothetical protein